MKKSFISCAPLIPKHFVINMFFFHSFIFLINFSFRPINVQATVCEYAHSCSNGIGMIKPIKVFINIAESGKKEGTRGMELYG